MRRGVRECRLAALERQLSGGCTASRGRASVAPPPPAHARATPATAAGAAVGRADGERVVEFLAELVRAQTAVVEGEACPGEVAVQAVVSARLSAVGCEVEEYVYEPSELTVRDEFADDSAIQTGRRTAVLGRLPAASAAAGGRTLILFAHPDGEPVKDTDKWKHEPFEAEQADGRLYGWGVADDLMGVAAGVCALELLATSGVKLRGEVVMASTPSKRHARGVIACMNAPGADYDGALYLHPAESGAGLHEIKALASGQLSFSITVEGQPPDYTEPGQTAIAHLGPSLSLPPSAAACRRPYLRSEPPTADLGAPSGQVSTQSTNRCCFGTRCSSSASGGPAGCTTHGWRRRSAGRPTCWSATLTCARALPHPPHAAQPLCVNHAVAARAQISSIQTSTWKPSIVAPSCELAGAISFPPPEQMLQVRARHRACTHHCCSS